MSSARPIPTEGLFVQCGPGLEPALERELTSLHLRGNVVPGGVELEASPHTYELVNLWSRVANRVLLRLGEVRTIEELRALPWGRYGTEFQVEAAGGSAAWWKETALKVLTEGPGPTVRLRGHEGRCTVSIDTSGELLHFRGYRQEIGRAPLRETLAAGVLELAGWAPPEPLWDVMCGSGTFLIEAAERAAGLAPGRGRKFAFEQFKSHDAARFASRPRGSQVKPAAIIGSDLNAGALGTARRNAKRAGVLESLKLERLDATKLVPRPDVGPGLIIANLPYGKRVGEKSELSALYKHLGLSLRKAAPGWAFALLLEEGEERLGLDFDSLVKINNGGLQCTVAMGHIAT